MRSFGRPMPPGAPDPQSKGGRAALRPTRRPKSKSRPPSPPRASNGSAARSPVQVLIVDQVNPVFTTPSAWRVREAIEKIPFIVSFASFIDETSALADLILPDHSFLESWVDSVPEAGTSSAVVNVAAPVMKPILDTRAMPDILLDISRRLKMQPALPWQT